MQIDFILGKIGSKLPPPIGNWLIYRSFLKRSLYKEMWGGGIYKNNLDYALRNNLSIEELSDTRFVKRLSKDIISSYLQLEATPEEYFVFGFRNKSLLERKAYLTNMTKDKILIDRIGWDKIYRLRDKYKLYQLLPELFRRDVCVISSVNDKARYEDFILRNNSYIAKPLDGMCGRGVAIYSGNHFNDLIENGKWILEELVHQIPEMARFNQSSVNTVRLPSFMKNGKFIPIAPFFRTGRQGSIVDNGAAGGVFAAIDVQTGEIISDGFDENNRSYESHPDSRIQFKGFQIPLWSDLLNVAEYAHQKLSDQRYIAWDFALTDKGWTLIEANSMGQFLWQYATKIGIRQTFLQLMAE